MIHVCYRKDFATFAETCFQKFGDRVKHWITFNEPHTFTTQGYDVGLQAPGRCSILLHLFCRAGNSATEPYIVAHNVLLTHATVTDIYRKKYKVKLWISQILQFRMQWNKSYLQLVFYFNALGYKLLLTTRLFDRKHRVDHLG